jgi:maltose alpha-D-glucosyltransferase/alpha-amylase
LFSAFQSLASRTWHSLEKNLYKIPENAKAEAGEILGMKKIVLDSFKSIYRKKVDGLKIRIHGDFHLGQALFTAKDIVLIDFEGEPAKAYSERRIKRSPLRDVAGMLRSFHYAAYGSLFLHNNTRQEDIEQLIPYVEQWQNIMSAIFVDAYLAKMNGSMLIPAGQEDIILLLKAYVLEKAVYELDYELNNRPEWVIIPMRGIQSIIGKKQ